MASSVENLKYHLVWATKYRYNLLITNVAILLKKYFESKQKLGFELVSCAIEPDHVHLLIKVESSQVDLNKLIAKLKGGSSKSMRSKFPYLKRYKSLWTPAHFVSSIGNVSQATIESYLAQQGLREDEFVVRTFKYKMLRSKRKQSVLKRYLEGVEEKDSSKAPAAVIQNAGRIKFKNAIALRNDLIKLDKNDNVAAKYWLRVPGGKGCQTKPMWIGLMGRDLPENFALADSYLKVKGREVFVYLAIKQLRALERVSDKKVLAIDLGLTHPITAVLMDEGKAKQVKHYGKNLKRLIWKRLQRQKVLNWAHAKYENVNFAKHLWRYNKTISDEVHKLTLSLVKQAKAEGAHLVVGNMAGISNGFRKGKSSKQNRQRFNVPYYKIMLTLYYKALLYEVPMVFVDEAYTSQRCSRCGYIDKNNRHRQHFCCWECGYKNQADANGAMNIGSWALASLLR